MSVEDLGRRGRMLCVCLAQQAYKPVPPFRVEILRGLGVLQLQDHHFVKFQEEGIQANLIQEGVEQLNIFRAEINFVPWTDFPKWLRTWPWKSLSNWSLDLGPAME